MYTVTMVHAYRFVSPRSAREALAFVALLSLTALWFKNEAVVAVLGVILLGGALMPAGKGPLLLMASEEEQSNVRIDSRSLKVSATVGALACLFALLALSYDRVYAGWITVAVVSFLSGFAAITGYSLGGNIQAFFRSKRLKRM